MSFIEGIGDEVVLFFIIVFVFAVAALITLVGSVPSTGTAVPRRYEYEHIASEQRQTSELLVTPNSDSSRHRRRRPPASTLQTNSFIIEEASEEINGSDNVNVETTVEETRTEADGSSVGDTSEDLRTDADGSAAVPPPEEATPEPPLDIPEVPEEAPGIGDINVRLKYLNDTERIVTTNPCTKIGDFKKNHFRDTIRENKIVRLIFAGRLLQDTMTIENCRILNNSVVHVQVLPAQTVQSNQTTSQSADLDVGRLLVPAVTVILGMCWVLYSKYPEFFSTLSLGVLGTFSCLFFAYVVQTHR